MKVKSDTFTLHKPAIDTLNSFIRYVESQYTSCRVICHNCGHEWIYMGIRLASLRQSNKPVRVLCPRCHNRVKMDLKNARGPGLK